MKQRKRKRPAARPRPRSGITPRRPPNVRAQTVEFPVPFLEVVVRERLNESSMMGIFEQICAEVLGHTSRRVFVDMRESEVNLSISDMTGIAKLVGEAFAGRIDRLAMLLRPQDMPAEKFFEPSVRHRGVPTLTTTDLGDALHFLTAKLQPNR